MPTVFKVNAQVYAAFVEAFRAAGAGGPGFHPNFRSVGLAMGTTEHTAKRAWVAGFRTHSAKYGPIEELFPRVTDEGVTNDPHRVKNDPIKVTDDPLGVSYDPRAAASGAPSVYDAPPPDVGAQSTTPTYDHPPVGSASPSDASALTPALRLSVNQALQTLVDKQPAVLVRELEALEVNRNNAIGLNILMGKVIEKLMLDAPRLLDLQGVELTLAHFVEVTTDVAKVTTLMVAAQAKLMESQRLLMGMPSVITEHRTTGDAANAGDSPATEAKRQRLGPLIGLLARAGAASAYTGEEGGDDVIDVQGTPVGNTGRFVGSTGKGEGLRAKDVAPAQSGNGEPIDPLLSVK